MKARRTDPVVHLQTAAWDVVFAVLFACLHYRYIPLPDAMEGKLPPWLWPALALIMLFSGLWSYHRYRQLRRELRGTPRKR